MNQRWASLGAVGLTLLTLHCESGLLLDSIPTMNGQWIGYNRRYQLIYNGVTLTQGRADTSFSGTGTWENPLYSGSLHVTGVLARGTVRMTLQYDSSATARFASYTGVLSSDLMQVSGVEVFGADSTDSLFLEKCTHCEAVFPFFARSAGAIHTQ
jgi:hypothetical protein